MKKVPLLKNNHVKDRLEYAQRYINFDFKKVIFSDETSFYLFDLPKKAWIKKDHPKVGEQVKHPSKVHAWGCFSFHGFGKLVLFEETLNANLMVSTYRRGLFPTAKQ